MTAKQVTRTVTARTTRNATAAPPLKIFVLLPGMRPTSGPRLRAHTAAALEILGITENKAAPVERLQALIGPTALKWHTSTLHTLQQVGPQAKLTRHGKETFLAREKEGSAPRALIDAFKAVFSTGKPSAMAEVKAHHISATPV